MDELECGNLYFIEKEDFFHSFFLYLKTLKSEGDSLTIGAFIFVQQSYDSDIDELHGLHKLVIDKSIQCHKIDEGFKWLKLNNWTYNLTPKEALMKSCFESL